MTRFREVLFKKNFFSLWSGQIVSEFGDRLNQMALIALIYSKEPGSVMAMAKLLFFVIVPVFIVGPVAGVYVDRWNRKKIMILSDVLRGLMVLLIPLFIWLNVMWPIYVVVFFIFSATRFFLPSKMALIPAIVSRDKLLVANSLSNSTRMIASILGFALAGFIVKWVGHLWGFYLDSMSYFVSAGLIALISPRKNLGEIAEGIQTVTKDIKKVRRKNVWSEIVEGLRYMFDEDKMKVVTGTLFLLMAGTGAIFCVIIVFIQEAFGSVTEALGIFGVFLGVGLFLGTVLYGKFGQAFQGPRVIFASLTLCGAAVGVFAFYVGGSPVFVVGGALLMLVGITAAPILTCTNTMVHTLVPDEVRGRIFSSLEAVVHLAFLLFMLLSAYLARFISNKVILLVSGAIFAAAGLAGLVLILARRNRLAS